MSETAQWLTADEGWGRQATDFATLSEPANCREYAALHHLLGVREGDRLLDVACGAGLAVELAAIRGARCAGIDASQRLVAIARDRVPVADLQVGDMAALPWPDGSFDVVTSCRGIWATTPDAVAEALRVLVPGGRLGLTVWGHIKVSPGAWALRPFTLAAPEKVAAQAQMVSLGRPGVGEDLLRSHGFTGVRRHDVPFVWEFPDPHGYARALASTGPAYEAIRAVGEDQFHQFAVQVAEERVREGLPLRAELRTTGFTARAPRERGIAGTFLSDAPSTPATQSLIEDDLTELGYVMNATRVWMHDPNAHAALFELLGHTVSRAGLSRRDRGVLVSACASTIDDAYCSLAWGQRLAATAGSEVAAAVLSGRHHELDDRSRTLAAWARAVAGDACATGPADVEALRGLGLDDAQVLAVTLFVALRVAFSITNNALGAHPDSALADSVAPQVRDSVQYGRPPM
jgi:SAM-dependent methyltransferase/alkylhydroperoxidase family enzyme